MARSDTRYSVYPGPKAVEVVGILPALNQGIECWAALLTRAIADNEKSFSRSFEDLSPSNQITYKLIHDWRVLAEVLKDRKIDPDYPNPGQLLATAVEDAQRLENIGLDWKEVPDFLAENMPQNEIETGMATLQKNLLELDYAHSWALITTVQWFWDHANEGMDLRKDSWWTLAFRRKWSQTQTVQREKPDGVPSRPNKNRHTRKERTS